MIMGEHVNYIVLESGIHHFIWLDNSREAVYAQAEYYKDLNAGLSPDETIRLLIDLRQAGAPPFRTLADVIGKSGMRNDVNYRTAYLSDDNIVPILMKNFVVVNRISGNRGFFKSDEETQAIEWLLSAE
jgi:hypothetical protein